jgi:hypothetical protein
MKNGKNSQKSIEKANLPKHIKSANQPSHRNPLIKIKKEVLLR